MAAEEAAAKPLYKWPKGMASMSGTSDSLARTLSENTHPKVQPCFWCGCGTGAKQQPLQAGSGFRNSAGIAVSGTLDLSGGRPVDLSATLMNDEAVSGDTLAYFDAGCKRADIGMLKSLAGVLEHPQTGQGRLPQPELGLGDQFGDGGGARAAQPPVP